MSFGLQNFNTQTLMSMDSCKTHTHESNTCERQVLTASQLNYE